MSRLILTLLATLTLALIACANNEESPNPEGIPIIQTITPTPNIIGDAITICTEIGVPGEATPSSPTPESSCEPGDDFTSIPGVRGTLADPPPLPSGTTALSRYLEFEIDQSSTRANISLPLITEATSSLDAILTPIWYTYDSGQWRALDTTVQIHKSTISGQNAMASGDFDPVPANLILLGEP